MPLKLKYEPRIVIIDLIIRVSQSYAVHLLAIDHQLHTGFVNLPRFTCLLPIRLYSRNVSCDLLPRRRILLMLWLMIDCLCFLFWAVLHCLQADACPYWHHFCIRVFSFSCSFSLLCVFRLLLWLFHFNYIVFASAMISLLDCVCFCAVWDIVSELPQHPLAHTQGSPLCPAHPPLIGWDAGPPIL